VNFENQFSDTTQTFTQAPNSFMSDQNGDRSDPQTHAPQPQTPVGWSASPPNLGEMDEHSAARVGVAGKLIIIGTALILLAFLGYMIAMRLGKKPQADGEAPPSHRTEATTISPIDAPISPTDAPISPADAPTPPASSVTAPASTGMATWRVVTDTDGFTYKRTGEALFTTQGTRIYACTDGGGVQIRHVVYGILSGDGGGAVYEVEVPRTSELISSIVPGFAFTVHFDIYENADGTATFIEGLRP
jgi:hypothetical protein